MVYNESPGEATGTLLGQSIINAIVIVGAICAVTFVLVLCYKYRCIKVRMLMLHVARDVGKHGLGSRRWFIGAHCQCMIGYLIFASASLLGYSGGFVVMTAFEVYRVTISWPTFVFLMYNFAMVGVVAVFWQKVSLFTPARHARMIASERHLGRLRWRWLVFVCDAGHSAHHDAGLSGGCQLHHGMDRRQAS